MSDFRREADSGDLILFKGSSIQTKVMRTVTRSDYDHVAMLLRYSNGKLVMFEATGMSGVAVLDFDVFLRNNWFKFYHKISFRKVKFRRT